MQTEESLNVSKTNVLQSQKMFVQAGNSNMCEKNVHTKLNESRIWHCNNCSQPSHNAPTCQIDSLSSKEKDNM